MKCPLKVKGEVWQWGEMSGKGKWLGSMSTWWLTKTRYETNVMTTLWITTSRKHYSADSAEIFWIHLSLLPVITLSSLYWDCLMLSLCLQFHVHNIKLRSAKHSQMAKFYVLESCTYTTMATGSISSILALSRADVYILTHCRVSSWSFIPQNFFVPSKHLGCLPGADLPRYPHLRQISP